MSYDEAKIKENRVNGDIRDWLPMMYGVGVVGIPIFLVGTTIKIAEMLTNSTTANGGLVISIGLLGMAVGIISEITRRKFMRIEKQKVKDS